MAGIPIARARLKCPMLISRRQWAGCTGLAQVARLADAAVATFRSSIRDAGAVFESCQQQLQHYISVFPCTLSETDDDDGHHCRAQAISGRSRRAVEPDGAFGLFGDRHFPA